VFTESRLTRLSPCFSNAAAEAKTASGYILRVSIYIKEDTMAKEKAASSKKATASKSAKAAPAKKVGYPDKFTMTTMVAFVAEKVGISKKQAKDSIEAYLDVVAAGMLAGNRVPVGAMGKAYVRERPATKKRIGRNPKTGESVTIPAKPAVRVPKFTYGKAFKESAKKAKIKK
jgi:nucleoid DNA-binding protein